MTCRATRSALQSLRNSCLLINDPAERANRFEQTRKKCLAEIKRIDNYDPRIECKFFVRNTFMKLARQQSRLTVGTEFSSCEKFVVES